MILSDDIRVIQGSLGSGKSLVAMYEVVDQLQRGGVVACNFNLVSDWAIRLAKYSLRSKLGLQNDLEVAQSYYERCYLIGNTDSMIELSGARGVRLNELCVGKAKNKREGKGLLVIDDCHHFFNARTFAKNEPYVRFFANARKYGWRTLLITHDVDNIDKQIRSYIEIECRFRDLNKVKIPFTPFPVSPIKLFIVRRKYYGLGVGSGANHSLDLYPFDIRIANLYDTLERFGEDNPIGEVRYQGVIPGYCSKPPRKIRDYSKVHSDYRPPPIDPIYCKHKQK